MPDYLKQFLDDGLNRVDLGDILKEVFPDTQSVVTFCRNYLDPYAGVSISGKLAQDSRDTAVDALLIQIEQHSLLFVIVVSLCCINAPAISTWANSAAEFIAERIEDKSGNGQRDTRSVVITYVADYCRDLGDKQRKLFVYSQRAHTKIPTDQLPLLVQALERTRVSPPPPPDILEPLSTDEKPISPEYRAILRLSGRHEQVLRLLMNVNAWLSSSSASPMETRPLVLLMPCYRRSKVEAVSERLLRMIRHTYPKTERVYREIRHDQNIPIPDAFAYPHDYARLRITEVCSGQFQQVGLIAERQRAIKENDDEALATTTTATETLIAMIHLSVDKHYVFENKWDKDFQNFVSDFFIIDAKMQRWNPHRLLFILSPYADDSGADEHSDSEAERAWWQKQLDAIREWQEQTALKAFLSSLSIEVQTAFISTVVAADFVGDTWLRAILEAKGISLDESELQQEEFKQAVFRNAERRVMQALQSDLERWFQTHVERRPH